jgi:hypothetical protein
MASGKTDDEIIEMVRRGGGQALTAMGIIIDEKRDYPGDANDVFGLLSDMEPISFGCSPSHLAQAYLFHKGLIKRSDVEDCWQTADLLKCWETSDGQSGV